MSKRKATQKQIDYWKRKRMQQKYYAVVKGRKLGVYLTYPECKRQINGFKGSSYRSFKLKDEAESYLKDSLKELNEDNNKKNTNIESSILLTANLKEGISEEFELIEKGVIYKYIEEYIKDNEDRIIDLILKRISERKKMRLNTDCIDLKYGS